MVDRQPSSDLDDLFNFGAPQTAQPAATQFLSRRELREAEALGAARVAVAETPAPVEGRAEAQRRVTVAAPAAPAAPRGRKLKASEVRAMRASAPKAQRKNPVSVLVTMTVVGGLFAVAGLPAYAQQSSTTAESSAKTDADAQNVVVSADASALTPVRDGYRATTYDQLAQMEDDAQREANQADYLASGARELGDDYPWPYELRDYQGGGLSPLNYYYRECVDFVAWRLNRDAGSYAAPYKWVWSNLTPMGGNASQWRYNWEARGWPVSDVPVVGAVADMGGNHVAYVKRVNGDGTVLLEEYNWSGLGKYSQRVVPNSAVQAFLYPPPA